MNRNGRITFWFMAILIPVILIGFGFGYGATGMAEPVYGGTLWVAIPAEPPALDPTTHAGTAIVTVVHNTVLEGLVKVNQDGQIVPAIADSWEISADGLTFTFHLHPGVKFHNGRTLTAADVKFTIERALDPDSGFTQPRYFTGVSAVEVVDDHTVRIKLDQVNANLLYNLTLAESVIVPQETVDTLSSAPIGTGPFKFVSWVPGSHITLEQFADYYRPGLPYLDEVSFRFIPEPSTAMAALQTGAVDVVTYLTPENVFQVQTEPLLKLIYAPTIGNITLMAINNAREPFTDLRVRQAINYAIDQEEVIEGAQFGFAARIGSHMSPANPFYIDLTDRYEYDPEKAKALLAEAGYPNGFKATLKLPQPFEYAIRSGEIIADQLARVGIDLNLQIIEWGTWLDQVYQGYDYDLTIVNQSRPYGISSYYPRPSYYFRYDNPQVQQMVSELIATADVTRQAEIYAQLQRTVADDAVNVFLFNLPALIGLHDNVQNWWTKMPAVAADITEVYKTR
ncbi:MAG: ABC transporter substrate-binding protein [Candidatus Bipolaricaulia bacterium]